MHHCEEKERGLNLGSRPQNQPLVLHLIQHLQHLPSSVPVINCEAGREWARMGQEEK